MLRPGVRGAIRVRTRGAWPRVRPGPARRTGRVEQRVEVPRAVAENGWEVGAEDGGRAEVAQRLERGGESGCVDVLHPWAVDGHPEQLPRSQLVCAHGRDVLGAGE